MAGTAIDWTESGRPGFLKADNEFYTVEIAGSTPKERHSLVLSEAEMLSLTTDWLRRLADKRRAGK